MSTAVSVYTDTVRISSSAGRRWLPPHSQWTVLTIAMPAQRITLNKDKLNETDPRGPCQQVKSTFVFEHSFTGSLTEFSQIHGGCVCTRLCTAFPPARTMDSRKAHRVLEGQSRARVCPWPAVPGGRRAPGGGGATAKAPRPEGNGQHPASPRGRGGQETPEVYLHLWPCG